MKSSNVVQSVKKNIPHPVKDKINYEDLLELMHVRHQTTLARRIEVKRKGRPAGSGY